MYDQLTATAFPPAGPVPAPPSLGRPADMGLDERYLLERGTIFLSGVQALVRLLLDQRRADRRSGVRTATLVSGYQGSPLAGFDRELQRIRSIAEEHDIVHVPGLNEELAATAAWGSQLAPQLPGARHDGVLSVWYGKAPGLDRAMDALRHGNFAGTSRTGGALALVGDDPSCKSSTLPSASEATLAALLIPTFFPGSVHEVLELGRHAVACSRVSGLWSALKLVTSVADATGTAAVDPTAFPAAAPPLVPGPRGSRVDDHGDGSYEHRPSGMLLAPGSLELEQTLFGVRLAAARAYARAAGVNRIALATRDARIGLVAAGKAYADLRRALADLGLSDQDLERAGVRILKLGMIWPLEQEIVRAFARGLEEVIVVEDKLPFVERQLKEVLYGAPDRPRVLGKADEHGEVLLPAELELDADTIAVAIGGRLRGRTAHPAVRARLDRLGAPRPAPAPLPLARTPFFCSGCPHNSSTAAPAGALVGVGIGCHTMVMLSPEGKGRLTGVTQMGGEGAQWIGMSPLTADEHFVQNLGDGTFFHSGSLAVRAAVAAGVNITYKVLYNGAVAMTGGQAVQGVLAVPELTRLLELEGVRRIIVTTEDRERYRGVELAPIAEVRDRRELLTSQRELAQVPGVTVLVHDQHCAAELRRERKRGTAPDPPERVWINERVCEGCGDCGRKSSCLSVVPVDTEFGRKTQIHQTSCNMDYSCLEGDCPAFVTVVPDPRRRRPSIPAPPPLPDPPRRAGDRDFAVRMVGIGGTGVVTVAQILATAAVIDGMHAAGLDQTGLSQKGGPVVSDLRISHEPAGPGRVSAAAADLYLAFDLLGASDPRNLAVADPGRTVAVISTSRVATGQMVVDPATRFPRLRGALDAIEAVTLRESGARLDAQGLAERLFDDHVPANLITLGAAYQCGALPVAAAAIEAAIRLNGAAVERNLAAFGWGRAYVAVPDAVEAAGRPAAPAAPVLSERARALVDRGAPAPGELRRLLDIRVPELIAYANVRYAERYVALVAAARAAEAARAPGRGGLAEAVARGLYTLMAYKDEYEVARLHLDAVERAKLEQFGPRAKVYFHLHPPLLRALGLERKLRLGPWFTPALRLLKTARRVRGTPFDPFGRARVRRVERELVEEYSALVAGALAHLGPETHALAVELCELPQLVRGYEGLKLRSAERFRERAARLSDRLRDQVGAPQPGAAVSVAGDQ